MPITPLLARTDTEHAGSRYFDDVDENTPLLANANASHNAVPDPVTASAIVNADHRDDQQSTPDIEDTANNKDGDEKPLPKFQIFLLCYNRAVEPIAFFCIFPFVNQMIASNGDIAPADVGFYSGLIESLFSLTQMCVMILWGRAADRFGRKPVLVSSLVGISITTAVFGMAKSLWEMVVFRCAAGIFAGTIVTIRTMISEHSTAKTQARAFSWFAFSGNLGIFAGPLISGLLSEPANQYPKVFGRSAFFKEYPYALPTFATGTFAASAAVLSALFLQETLAKTKIKHTTNGTEDDSASSSTVTENEGPVTAWQLLNAPNVKPTLLLYTYIMFLAFSYTAVAPVFYYTPVTLGGYGFEKPIFISLFLGLAGLSQAIWLLLIFPPLQRRVGTGGVLRLCAWAYPWFFLSYPLTSMLLRVHSHSTEVAFWILAPMACSIGCGVSMSFTAIQLALNDVAPSMKVLGTLNALALTLTSGLRAVTPAAFTSLFAVGIDKQILKGYLIWVVLIPVAMGFTVFVRWLPEKAEGNINKAKNDQERRSS